MHIKTSRFLLRDFVEADRSAFVAYQMDTRYLGLYDFDADDVQRAHDLFDLFVAWQKAAPRDNLQLGVFEIRNGQLLGSGGLRRLADDREAAVLGIELAPDHWGRYRLALDVVQALGDYGFRHFELCRIIADSSSGNTRVAKIAEWFGAEPVARREGPDWMARRGWHEVDWSLSRSAWTKIPQSSSNDLR